MAYAPSEPAPNYDPPLSKDLGPGAPAKPGRGCWFYGCIVLVVLGLIGILAIAAASYTAYYYLKKTVEEYTATEPMALPPLTVTPEERKSIDDRWKVFKESADKGEAAELVLTANDLNALISENETFKGTVFVTIEGSEIGGKISFPLEKTGLPLTQGRYLNGNATFTVSIDYGEFNVNLKSVEVNGKAPSAEMMTQLSSQNLMKDAKFDDETRAKLREIESLVVKDGTIILKSRSKGGEAAAPKTDEPKAEAPAADTPKTEEPKPEGPKTEAPKAEAPAAEAPKTEEPKAEEPKTEAPKAEESKAEVPKAA